MTRVPDILSDGLLQNIRDVYLPIAQVVQLDTANKLAVSTVERLKPVVDERREKMKEEMLGEPVLHFADIFTVFLSGALLLFIKCTQCSLARVTKVTSKGPFGIIDHTQLNFDDFWIGAGKLKDLGNSLLGKFGMSLDNFKTQKDPATGSYSINFSQN